MKSLSLIKIKSVIKINLPFIRHRWRIYNTLWKIKHLIYYRTSEKCCQNDLSKEIFFTEKYKLEIETVNESNRDALIEFAENNEDKNLYKNWAHYFYKNNYKGFIALFQGKIIGYIWWWANNSIRPPWQISYHNIKLRNDAVYMFNFYIAPQYRGGGNAIEFLTRVISELRKLGYKSAIGTYGSSYLPAAWIYKITGFNDIRYLTSHIFFNRVAYIEKAIFLKNYIQHPYYPLGCTPLMSFRNLF